MKAFIVALLMLLLLVGAVVLLSLLGEGRVEDYLAALPSADAAPSEAREALAALFARVEEERLLLGLLFSHERIDELLSAVARAQAAAVAGEMGEYAPILAELTATLGAMKRDLTLSLADIL